MAEEKAADAAAQQAEVEAQKQADAKRTYSDEEFKKLVAERDRAKERLRLIDEAAKKAEEDKKIQEGKAQELLAEKQLRLDELEAKAKAYEEQQGKLRDSLLGKLTDEADKIAGESIKDLDKLSRYVELRTQKQGGPFGGKGSGVPTEVKALKLPIGGGKLDAPELREKLREFGIAP